ncbi:uncharacterized protein LOC110020903 [Phalaenopsis equestris]|uniref:uncharacterized protein LOC110020903 n=1 Tax=Phalaenopsis equestris TaxID=78828 RepID=UPI0009E531BE|nr:uncharacterized protein LOC110020903 [Phalaenopsis equestris]
MNRALKPAYAASLPFFKAVSFFHSSPVLERKRRSPWNYRCNISEKRKRRMESRRTLLRDISEYAEYLFQSWKDDNNTLWFRKPYWSKGSKLNGFNPHESPSGRSKNKGKDGFIFCASDDDDVENIFHSAFGREGFYYSASSRDGSFQWRCSSGNYQKCSSDWRYETDEETDEDSGADTCPQPNLTSERLTLGLSASGPLKLNEIKSAYRACALQWHPDRHQGASKVIAEEKFKICSTAYKSLCDRLATS